MSTSKPRESSFELLRLLAMFTIVLYHFYCHNPLLTGSSSFNKAVWIPLHIGVPVFVLISGYFGIRASGKGLFRLLGQMLLYTAPIALIYNHLYDMGGVKTDIKSLLFVSNTEFWFMRSYICLYLISPVLNLYLQKITPHQRLYLFIVLGFIAIYMGTVAVNDASLRKGGNIFTFMFLYFVGNTLRTYADRWKRVPVGYYIIAYILLNCLLVAGYCLFDGTIVAKGIYRLSFPYNSPIMQINAVLLFVIVGRYSFQSKTVNWLGASALAIYLIHESRFVRYILLQPVVSSIHSAMGNDVATLAVLAVLAIIVCLVCIVIDKLLTPLWGFCQRLGEKAERKAQSLSARLISRASSR